MFVTKLRFIQQYRNSTIEVNGIINLQGIKMFQFTNVDKFYLIDIQSI